MHHCAAALLPCRHGHYHYIDERSHERPHERPHEGKMLMAAAARLALATGPIVRRADLNFRAVAW